MEPTINVYRDLIVPMGERMRMAPQFADIKNVIFDTDEVPLNEMPVIEYYVESPWEDIARGSGSYTLQTRRLTARLVFGLWVYDTNRQRMNEQLFHLGGLLLDFIRELTDFEPVQGVGLSKAPVVWQVTHPETQTGFVGYHSVSAEFDIYSGTGK